MWRQRLLMIPALLTFLATPGWAFERPFPENAKRGTMTPANFPNIIIDGKARRLTPGARIWNRDNLIQMPASIRGSDFTVNYTEDAQGQIERVWILTPEEVKKPLPK